MARRKAPEEHENHERWLVSYADFITLLFAFFVVMYALSSVNEGKYRVLSDSLSAVFRGPTRSLAPIQVGELARSPAKTSPMEIQRIDIAPTRAPISIPKPPIEPLVDANLPRIEIGRDTEGKQAKHSGDGAHPLQAVGEKIDQAMGDLIDKDLVSVRRTPDGIEIEIKESVVFGSGSAKLGPGSDVTLKKIADLLRDLPNLIDVEGHTDDVPIATRLFPSNWELSAARAASVVHLFTRLGIRPQRLAAIGYSAYKPVAENTTPEGRRRNRRVIIVVNAKDSGTRLAPQSSDAGNES